MTKPIVSIIIPHFNRSQLLKITVNSVLQQTYSNVELIIVDDGSDEIHLCEVMQLEKKHRSIKIYTRTSLPKGPSHCRNIGVRYCIGEYILFLDSDDLLAPYCLEQRVLTMEQNSEVDAGIFKMGTFNSDDNLNDGIIYNSFENQDEWIPSFIENKNPWNVTCPLWKTTIFKKIGGFDEDFFYMEDPEIHLRLLAEDECVVKTFYNLPVDSYYRINNMDETKNDFFYNSIFYRLKFYNKIYNDIKLNKFLAKHSHAFNNGIIMLVRQFLFAKATTFPDLLKAYLELLQENKFMGVIKKKLIVASLKIGSSKNIFVNTLRLKGFAYKLLPKA